MHEEFLARFKAQPASWRARADRARSPPASLPLFRRRRHLVSRSGGRSGAQPRRRVQPHSRPQDRQGEERLCAAGGFALYEFLTQPDIHTVKVEYYGPSSGARTARPTPAISSPSCGRSSCRSSSAGPTRTSPTPSTPSRAACATAQLPRHHLRVLAAETATDLDVVSSPFQAGTTERPIDWSKRKLWSSENIQREGRRWRWATGDHRSGWRGPPPHPRLRGRLRL